MARMNRRRFLGTTAAAAAAVTVVPRHVLGGPGYVAPSDQITAACIGVGSQGTRVMMDFLKQSQIRIVSVCDVNRGSDDYIQWGDNEIRDKVRELIKNPAYGASIKGCRCGMLPAKEIVEAYYALQKESGIYSGCRAYEDFRELLDKEQDVDAVIIGTADHAHAPVAIHAMRKGKHVFCQKPMTNTVHAARLMAGISKEMKVATQVATGNAASEDTRVLCEWIWAGVIGPVREVHNWSARPFWPQGMDRPAEKQPVPKYLNWDLWLGPAPFRPYHMVYLPFVWRGWYDFGSSAIGDMGCYSFDTLFRVLRLDAPAVIDASSTVPYLRQKTSVSPFENKESYPASCMIHFDFPARGDMPPVAVHWYDGALKPAVPAELGDEAMPEEGMLFVGDDGKILCGFNGRRPRLIPKSKMDLLAPPPKTLPRSIGHLEEWIEACKGGAPAAANFEFAGRVTETILAGNVATRLGKKIQWDGQNLQVPGVPEADAIIHPPAREGWEF